MGSIVMHLCVSNEANKILKLDNNRFLIGSIAPDVHKIASGSRIESHYIKKTLIDGKKYELPDLEKFLIENKEKMLKDDYYKGYYAHLISDYIWYKENANKYTAELTEDKQKIRLVGSEEYIPYSVYKKKIYDDYNNINDYLIEKYNINVNYLYDVAVLNIENSELRKLLKTVCNNGQDNLKLNILKIEDVENWIEISKKEIINSLKYI